MNHYTITIRLVHDAGHRETLALTTKALRDAGLDVWHGRIEHFRKDGDA